MNEKKNFPPSVLIYFVRLDEVDQLAVLLKNLRSVDDCQAAWHQTA